LASGVWAFWPGFAHSFSKIELSFNQQGKLLTEEPGEDEN
jgi:hypothetical protein